MDVVVGGADTFASFKWGLSSGNTFDITFSSNLAGVLIHSAEAGLVTTVATNPITLNLSSADGIADVIKLDGFTAEPGVVGAAASGYDVPSGTLTVFSQPFPTVVTITPQ